MKEISLAKLLSGNEVLESILYEMRQKLSRNSRFQQNMAYPAYRAEIKIRLFPSSAFIPPAEYDILAEERPDGCEVSSVPSVEETIEVPVRPPNQVRVESELPLPVLSQDEKGNPVEKWVRKKKSIPVQES